MLQEEQQKQREMAEFFETGLYNKGVQSESTRGQK